MAEPLTGVSLVIGAWGAGVAPLLAANQVRHDRRTLKGLCVARYLGPPTIELILVRAVSTGYARRIDSQLRLETGTCVCVGGLPRARKACRSSWGWSSSRRTLAENTALVLGGVALFRRGRPNRFLADFRHHVVRRPHRRQPLGGVRILPGPSIPSPQPQPAQRR